MPVDIDITSNTISLDYSSTNSGTFSSGTFNGYIFSDLNNTIPNIHDVSIDSTTTLGIDASRISFNENQIFINVASLFHDRNSKIKLNISFSPTERTCTGSVSPNLDIHVPSLNYQSLTGTQNIWADFEFYGQGANGELLWKLKDFNVNQ